MPDEPQAPTSSWRPHAPEDLTRAPDALVAAIGEDGFLVPMPPEVPIAPERVLQGETMLDFVRPEDHGAVVRAFTATGHDGVGYASVHLRGDRERTVTIWFADLRHRYGVFLAAIVDDDSHTGRLSTDDIDAARSRFATVHYTLLGTVLDCDEAYTELFGWHSDQIAGVEALQGIHPEDQSKVTAAWLKLIATGQTHAVRFRQLCADGTWKWAAVHNQIDQVNEGQAVGHVIDITDEVATEEALRARELLLNRIAQVVPVGLVHIALDGSITYANDRLHEIVGTPPGASVEELLATVHGDDRPRAEAALQAALVCGEDTDVEVEVVAPGTGEHRRLLANIRPVTDGLGTLAGAIACVSDVTAFARRKVELEEELVNQAFHDQLTGLPNRTHLLHHMHDALNRSKRTGDLVALLLADLDGFKQINDSYGHTVGDEVLRIVSDRMRTILRGEDIAARVGGDEFVLLLQGFIDPDRPRHVADAVLAALAQPFEVDGRSLRLGVSIGIATSATARSPEELLRDADVAMYRAKASGRSRFELFAPEMHEAVVTRLELEGALREGLEQGQLVVYYQPIHALARGGVASVEALLRWRHPTRGLVPPADFIPLAEETGLIVPIGRFVLEQACTEAASWTGPKGFRAPQLSVNLSARQLASPTLVDDVVAALDVSGLDPRRLVLEITESVLMEGLERNFAILDRLKGLGAHLAIDDFGTGYSSLAYLQRLPVDVLKIDKVFVDRITEGGRHRALIEGILKLSESLGLRTVAEGIETDGQLSALTELGCGGGQGYLFSRPVDPGALRHYFEAPARASFVLSTSDPVDALRRR